MLKNILIPEKIGQHYLFKQNVLGIEINKNNVKAVQVSISGKKTVKLERILQDNLKEHSLKNTLSAFDKYDYLKISIPSYLVIFKELSLPFVDEDKIRSILNFEIEPILPFSINEVVSDFIITKLDKQKKETTIMVAIVRKKDILDLLEPFKNSGLKVTNVLVDTFSLFGLYSSNQILTDEAKESALLIDMHEAYCNIVYLQDGQLKLIKSIHSGLNNFSTQPTSQELNDLTSTIAFTINSFKSIMPSMSSIKNLILPAQTAQIKGLSNLLFENLNIPAQVITINTVIEKSNIKTDKSVDESFIQSLSNAYPSDLNENFNLLRAGLAQEDDKLLKNQLITASSFLFIIFSIFIGYSYWQTSKLKTEITNSKKQATNALNDTFNINDKFILKNLSETINVANNKVSEDENIWFSFSTKTRFSYLKYLNELTKMLNDPAIGLTINSLSISQGLITLDGYVNNFDELSLLEKKLNESNLFSHITVPQETKFTIKLTIKKNED